jgi:hypothetical protein
MSSLRSEHVGASLLRAIPSWSQSASKNALCSSLDPPSLSILLRVDYSERNASVKTMEPFVSMYDQKGPVSTNANPSTNEVALEN